MAVNKTYRNRRDFVRDMQLEGFTYDQAVEMWHDTDEIADTFEHDGIRTAEEITDLDIKDAIADHRAVKQALASNVTADAAGEEA